MGIILYENLEIGYVPETPAQPYFESSLLHYAQRTLLQYAGKFGYPISYIQEQKGSLIQNSIFFFIFGCNVFIHSNLVFTNILQSDIFSFRLK